MSSATENQRLEHFDIVLEQRKICQEAWSEWQHFAEIAKAKKKKYEAERNQLDVVLDEDPAQKKLFTASEDPAEPTDDSAPAITTDEWSALDVNQLQHHGITESQCEKLSEHGLQTLGDLQSLMQKEGQWWWKEVKGVGEGKAEKIADAMNAIIMAAMPEGEEIDAEFEVRPDSPADEPATTEEAAEETTSPLDAGMDYEDVPDEGEPQTEPETAGASLDDL